MDARVTNRERLKRLVAAAEPCVKTCGMFRAQDVEAVNRALPDMCGFIVNVPQSPRNVTPAQAAELAAALDGRVLSVGVFVDEPLDSLVAAVEQAGFNAVQLHGSEDKAYVAKLREAVADVAVIQAFKVAGAADLRRAAASTADAILLDAGQGSGKAFNWALLEGFTRPYLLAGGIGPENVEQAWEQVHPAGFDMSSSLETNGVKDAAKIAAATKAVQRPKKKGKYMTQEKGRYGVHGGQYIPETLMNAIAELEQAYEHYKNDPAFTAELAELLNNYANRPSNLYFARRMTEDLGGAKIYLKREDLNHTGAHKINNALGQVLLAKYMGKTRVIAETGAGQHGVATATAAALLGMECEVYMGVEDMERQALNVYRMRLLGSQVHGVATGTGTLKDAVSETFREWTRRIADTHYVIGSCMGPHPFPMIVRDFQAFISAEIKQQMQQAEGALPNAVIACVGGGSNAIGSFYHFFEDESVRLIGCEAAGRGINTFETAATLNTGRLGIFHGMKSYFCQDEDGQIAPVYSISAGLDYPGIGPEHSMLHDTGRAEYVAITDEQAVDAFEYLSRMEGIIPAIESAHAVAYARELAPTMGKDETIVITLSGRGDKDVAAIARYRGEDIHE